MAVRILLVDDHPLFLKGLQQILGACSDLQIIGEARDGEEAIQSVREKQPDVVVMDISMPGMDGIKTTLQIIHEFKQVKVLALSIHPGKHYVNGMLDAGASGYLLKESAPEELVKAILKIAEGNMYLSSTITGIALGKEGHEHGTERQDILYTKLHRPPVTDDLIMRHELIGLLERSKDKSLSLISAPAGYGKSVTVSQWLENSRDLHAWISLDEEQSDLRIFLRYMQAAMESINPGSLRETGSLLQAAELPSVRVLSQTLINELDSIRQDFILVLDDYQRIKEERIHQLINALLRFPPRPMHLVILSRRDPPLKLSTLRLHGHMTEIRMEELEFSSKEIASLFQKLQGLKIRESTALSLQEKTEGWIVGLQMALHAVKDKKDADWLVANLKGDLPAVAEFLLDEVLKEQTAEEQDLLKKTSILDRFCAGLVEAVCLQDHEPGVKKLTGSEYIHWLIRANLFAIPLDLENRWFRYHHLFQELLQKQLMKDMNPDSLAHLHKRASDWYDKEELVEEAIHHALASGDPSAAVGIVEKYRDAALDGDSWYRVKRWLDMLPGDLQQHSPNLLLARAWIAHHEYQQDMLVELLTKASRLIEQEGATDALRGEIYYFQGIIHFYTGNGKSSLQLFEKSRAIFPGNQRHVEGQLEMHLNISLYMVGQKDKAISQLNKLVRQMRMPVNIFASRVVAGLAFIHMLSGDLPELIEEGRRLEAFARKSRLDYTVAFASYMQGYAHLHAWDPDPASKHLALTVQQRYILHIRASMDGIAGLALVQQLRGKTAAATATMDQLEEFITGLNKPEYMQVVYSCRGRIDLLRGDLVSALQWGELITETPSPAATFIWLEVPCITRVRILIAEGSVDHLDKASDLLKDLRQISEQCRYINQLIEISQLQALLLEKQGRREQALDALAEAAVLSGPGGWVRPFIESGPPMLALLLALQQRKSHPGYIEKLIKVLEHQTFDVETEAREYSRESQRGQLSWRELEVLTLLAEGLSNKEIADRLFISEATIKKHLHNSFKKLNTKNRFQLVETAIEIGLLDNK